MRSRAAIILAAAAGLWATGGCTGAGTPEETLEAFHGHMAAKDFARAADLASFSDEGAGAGREEFASLLAEAYDAEDLDYGRAEIRERKRLGPEEVEFAVVYPRRSRPSTPPATRLITVKRMRGGWRCIVELEGSTKIPERSD